MIGVRRLEPAGAIPVDMTARVGAVGEFRPAADGLPILGDAVARLLCLTVDTIAGGDQTILMARVEHAQLRRDTDPPATSIAVTGTSCPATAAEP
jgi:flavin reductase (DIM6/NTAB) family NADH-FMN oxidoreductase RutF